MRTWLAVFARRTWPVRERVPIDQVIGEVVTLRTAGAGSLKGLCPFHDERSPSFHVTPGRGLYYCFGCGEGGDVVDFLMKHDHLSFTEAIEKLAAARGRHAALRGRRRARPQRGPTAPGWSAANRAAADFFVAALASAGGRRSGGTFLAERGFDAEAQARSSGSGYAPKSWDGLLGHLRSRGLHRRRAAWPPGWCRRASAARSTGSGAGWCGRSGDAAGDVLGFGARKLPRTTTVRST